MKLFALFFAGLLICLGSMAGAHALQPGYLELRALGGDVWAAYWKVPSVSSGPMPINAVLPENCDARQAPTLVFDGAAFGAEWIATCPGGLQGGVIAIEGLERTTTDVLVRYELATGVAESRRLTAEETAFSIPVAQGWVGKFATYTVLGVDHILNGLDHLTFVFALILLIPDRGKLIGAVTAFTLAHSISLAAATLGWVILPSAPVEAVIALSIIFLALELVRPSKNGFQLAQRFPWLVTFAFGLLHGLGFARALLDIGLPAGDVPLALFAFNVGVEIGQLMFIGVVLVLGMLLARLYPTFIKSTKQPGGSGRKYVGYAIGIMASFWLVSRLAVF